MQTKFNLEVTENDDEMIVIRSFGIVTGVIDLTAPGAAAEAADLVDEIKRMGRLAEVKVIGMDLLEDLASKYIMQ